MVLREGYQHGRICAEKAFNLGVKKFFRKNLCGHLAQVTCIENLNEKVLQKSFFDKPVE
jgi:hypothetical protein